MINPTALDVLRNIEATISDKIEPSLVDVSARSATATVKHLLRHVIARLEHEGSILIEDISALHDVLGKAHRYFNELGEEDGGSDHASRIAAALTRHHDLQAYLTLEMLAERAGALRKCLYETLRHLQFIRRARPRDSEYAAIRAAIRDYLVTQVEREEQLIAPAFYGRGPRR